MATNADIGKLVDDILPDIVEIRHRLHQHPETALKEIDTAAFIREKLQPTGLRVLDPFLGTDVVALMAGKGKGNNATLRADIDALPLAEKTGLPYASQRAGTMHGCGHDGHAAMLIGAVRVLDKLKDRFAGSVRFVFQPGEEMAAAGIPSLLLIIALPFIASLTTGIAVGFVGASMPIVMQLIGDQPPTTLVVSTAVLAYGSGYIAMLITPVHVCLIVTNEHFKTGLFSSIRGMLMPVAVLFACICTWAYLLRVLF